MGNIGLQNNQGYFFMKGMIQAVKEDASSLFSKENATATGKAFNEFACTLLRTTFDHKSMQTFGIEAAVLIQEGGALPVAELGNVASLFGTTFLVKTIPYAVGSILLTTGTYLTTNYLYRKAVHAIGRPKLATRVKTIGLLTPYSNAARTVYHKFVKQQKEIIPVFNQEITRKIDSITQALKEIQKNKGFFQNLLLYGPGGTGKTMISEKIAREAGMNYVMMSGGDLAQYIKRGEHVTELNKLFAKINNSSRPTILFIDEFESLGKDRSTLTSAELLELENAFLNHTGTQSKKVMIIAATNRKSDLDEAVLTRFDYKIFIGPPAKKERIKIISDYLPQFFPAQEIIDFFPKEEIEKIAEKMPDLSGRVIFKTLNAIYCKKASTSNNRLTREMIDETVQDFVTQEISPQK